MTLKKSRCFDGHDKFPFMVSLSIYPCWTNALHHVLNLTHHILIKLATRQKVKVKTDNPFSCCVTECVHGIPWKLRAIALQKLYMSPFEITLNTATTKFLFYLAIFPTNKGKTR